MAQATNSRFEAVMRFAAPMWGLTEDHAVAAVTTDNEEVMRILEEATEEESRFNSEWVALGGEGVGGFALRVDLGMNNGTGLDLTLAPTDEDVEVLQGYDLVEVWVEHDGDPTACSFRTRPRRSDILNATTSPPQQA